MTAASGSLEFALLNATQRAFPLVPRPFAEVGRRLGLSEEEVLQRYRALAAAGMLSRVGAVFRPNTVGASALAALAVAESDLARVAELVSAQPEVNHNYEREHAWNLWFVVAARNEAEVEQALRRIESLTGLRALRLPLVEEFHIDLGFDLATGDAPREGGAPPRRPRAALGEREQAVVAALADGLPLTAEPYAEIGRRAGCSGDEVVALLARWLDEGILRRFGAVVRHRPLGYAANAMTVWDVPDDRMREAGRRLAVQPEVTLCYARPRRLPDWPYNLFCMVHGRERSAVRAAIDRVTAAAELGSCQREILFSRHCHVQRGARYGVERTGVERTGVERTGIERTGTERAGEGDAARG